MNYNDENVRAAIAQQAGEWFVANDDRSADAHASASLVAWLKTSPVHVEEFLGVSTIVRDLKEARSDPDYSLAAILARAQIATGTGEVPPVQIPWPRGNAAVGDGPSRRWRAAAVTMAACALLGLSVVLWRHVGPVDHPSAADVATALHFETRHGEQRSYRLADNSMLHLNTDSAVTIRYGQNERLAVLTSGQAVFEVAHEAGRAFRVIARSAEVVDLGTKFDVRLEHDSTVVTVIEGRVIVGSSTTAPKAGTISRQSDPTQFVQVVAGQQISVTEEFGPGRPVAVDAQNATAWLHREIVFDHEPLESVAAEYNRYASKPIEIATPALRTLQVSGVFATGDTEALIAFLRSLKGVRVEVTATRIRVSQD